MIATAGIALCTMIGIGWYNRESYYFNPVDDVSPPNKHDLYINCGKETMYGEFYKNKQKQRKYIDYHDPWEWW